MEHEEAQILFSDFLEGELSAKETARLRDHLDSCDTCRDELEDLRQTLSSLSGMKRVPPPPGFLGKVQQRIRRRSRGRFFAPDTLLNRIPFEWISFVIILIMLVVYLYAVQDSVTEVEPAPKGKPPAGEAAPPKDPGPAGVKQP